VILLVAPYDLSETCLAALRVAKFALSRGLEVKYLTPNRKLAAVDSYWDKKVVRFQNERVFNYIKPARRIVWFCCGRYTRYFVDSMADQPLHIYVPAWHLMSFGEWEAMITSDIVVHPTKACFANYENICDRLTLAPEVRRRVWCEWDVGIPWQPRSVRHDNGPKKLLVYCDRSTLAQPEFLRAFILEATSQMTGIDIEMVSTKQWNKYVKRLTLPFWLPGRVKFTTLTNYNELLARLASVDLCTILSRETNFGLVGYMSAAMGAPTVCPHVSPYDSLAPTEAGWHTVRGADTENFFGARSTTLIAEEVVQLVHSEISTTPPLSKLQHYRPKAREKQVEISRWFDRTWGELLE